MTKLVCVLAVLAAAISTSAVAKDLNQDRKAPAVPATQMTDSEMDRVTAGAANPEPHLGNTTACAGQGTCNFPAADARLNHFLITPGSGVETRTKF